MRSAGRLARSDRREPVTPGPARLAGLVVLAGLAREALVTHEPLIASVRRERNPEVRAEMEEAVAHRLGQLRGALRLVDEVLVPEAQAALVGSLSETLEDRARAVESGERPYDLLVCREQLERDLREALRIERENERLMGALMALGFLNQAMVNAIRAAGGTDLDELVSADLGVPDWRP